MATLILTTLVGVIFAFLATQNTQLVDLNLNGYVWTIPLYLVAFGSLLIGLLVSSIVSVIDSISAMFTIQDKNSRIRSSEKTVSAQEARIHDLEIENARLRGEKGELVESKKEIEREHHPNLVSRLRHNLS